MDPSSEEIARLLASRESRSVEFKQGLASDAKVARTLCAFANTRGGILLVGIGDRGEIFGAPSARESAARLVEIAAKVLEPALSVRAGDVEIERRCIVWCSVPISPSRPHAVLCEDGEREVLIRVGASNRVATAVALARIAAERNAVGSDLALQRAVLEWIALQVPDASSGHAGPTIGAFAAAHGIGIQRARRAFRVLELSGKLIAHGIGARRTYDIP